MADQTSRPPAPQVNDAQATEQRMRRALGLNAKGNQAPIQQRPDQARQRHRFVQDGGVPVVMLNHRTDESAALRERIGELEASLETERNNHAGTRRTVSEQQAQLQSLETRLAHAELAHREALAQERRARTALQEQISQLQAPPALRTAPKEAPELAEPPRKRGRPRIHPPKDPKPVRWWTPSFKAKTKA